MCGIAGILRQDGRPIDAILLHRMTAMLSHRGPDGEGMHIDGPVGLGHRRLAIIDLDTGAQPMASADGVIWITYNGEIYNYRQLRQDLIACGLTFRTRSDTEVILRGYEAWDVDVLSRLRGMFAFGIWDGRRRRLFLARDRVGIKPLVYAWDGVSLRFASEIKALLQDPEVARDLDWEAVRDYFTHLFVPGPRTIFRGIRKLPPASYLLYSAEKGTPEIHGYWTLKMAPDSTVTEADWLHRLGVLLDDTVGLHTVSDVPVGAFLSGGLDSSTIVACLARTSTTAVKTFAIGFDQASFDELSYARLVAGKYGTDHFEMVMRPDVISVLPRLAWQFDEPFGDASAIATYCVSRITREHVAVALSGDGGDENFAGYRRYAEALRLARQGDTLPLVLIKPLFRVAAACLPDGVRGRGFLDLLGMPPLLRYFRMMTFQRAETLATLLTPDVCRRVEPQPDHRHYERLASEAGTTDYLSALQFVDLHHYLPDDILAKVDRASMLASLETRVPLLDHELIEFAATIPPRLKFHNGHGKEILRRLMAPHLPGDILTRRKMGFGVPLDAWFRAELRDFIRDLLLAPRTLQRGIIRREAIEAVLDSHERARRDWSSQIWSLICYELWSRTWLDR